MKRFILNLLVFVMLLPGLACANVINSAPEKHAAGMVDCSGMKHKPLTNGPILFKDCTKADLQKSSDASVFKKPIFAKEGFSAPVIINILSLHIGRQALYPTGPPFVRLTSNITHPPVLLTSPRLRI